MLENLFKIILAVGATLMVAGKLVLRIFNVKIYAN